MFCDFVFFFSSRRRHTRYWRDWSSDVCSSDLVFDNAYMRVFPNMVVMAAGDESDIEPMLAFALDRGGPTSLRYPKAAARSEERRVGKEGRSRWSPYH